MEKEIELLQDLENKCGCYELGDYCYDREGNPTHSNLEECNQ